MSGGEQHLSSAAVRSSEMRAGNWPWGFLAEVNKAGV